MLPKELRLDPKLIPLVARTGRPFQHPFLTVRYLRNDTNPPQFAISVSTKVSPKAVVRNRIKRRLRPIIVDLVRENKVRPGQYLLVTRSAELAEVVTLHQILQSLLAHED